MRNKLLSRPEIWGAKQRAFFMLARALVGKKQNEESSDVKRRFCNLRNNKGPLTTQEAGH